MKVCKTCKVNQDESNYYRNRDRFLKTSCKMCYNKNRYTYTTKFDTLTTKQLKDIKERITKGQQKTKIARLYDITPGTFYYWIRQGRFA